MSEASTKYQMKECPTCKGLPTLGSTFYGYRVTCLACGSQQAGDSPYPELAIERWDRWVDEQKAGKECPDCGRPKAKDAADAGAGCCPKWWAINDADADADCAKHARAKMTAREPAGRYPPLPIGYVQPPMAPPSASAMSVREYYAAHCPMTMPEAYIIWAGARETEDPFGPGYRDSMMSIGLRQGKERVAFFEWWAGMRFEYADAMIKEEKSNG